MQTLKSNQPTNIIELTLPESMLILLPSSEARIWATATLGDADKGRLLLSWGEAAGEF